MATFLQIANEDPAVDLVTLLASLVFTAEQKSEEAKFNQELNALVAKEKYAEVIEKGFFAYIEKILDSEPEQINTAFNLSFALLSNLGGSTPTSFTERFAAALTSRKEHATLKIKLLTILFNLLESRSPLRRKILSHVITYTLSTDNAGVLVHQLSKIDEWLNEWQLSTMERAEFYLLTAQVADQTQQREKHQHYMLKYLRALQDADEKTMSQAQEHAVRAAIIAIQSPQLIDSDTLLSYKAVQQLKHTPKYAATYALLEIVATGDAASFVAFCGEHKGHMEAVGLNYDQTLAKMRTLTLISLAKAKPRLTYDEIKQHLLVSTDEEVESKIIESVMSGHVDAKMDESERAVYVERTVPRTFDKQTWQQLHTKLTAWKSNVHRVLSTLSSIRQQQQV